MRRVMERVCTTDGRKGPVGTPSRSHVIRPAGRP